MVPIGHHRIAPVDDPAEATVLDEDLAGAQVAVGEDLRNGLARTPRLLCAITTRTLNA